MQCHWTPEHRRLSDERGGGAIGVNERLYYQTRRPAVAIQRDVHGRLYPPSACLGFASILFNRDTRKSSFVRYHTEAVDKYAGCQRCDTEAED